jgi:hypothetical protein
VRRVSSIVLVLVFAALGACGSDDAASPPSATDETVQTPDETTLTSAPTTGAGTNAPSVTTGAPTIVASTAEPCEGPTGTDPISVDFPTTLSSLVGREIRTGSHPCLERVVLELQGDGAMPGYRVQYVDDPVRLSPSDLEVDIAGDATLVLSVGAWMTTMEGDGYQGPDRIDPTNVVVIQELRLIENFEGMHQWAIGLDRVRPFSVTTLSDPPRIVVDVGL